MVLPVKEALQLAEDVKQTAIERRDTGIPFSPYIQSLHQIIEDLGDTLYAVNAYRMAHIKAYEDLSKYWIKRGE